MDAAVEKTRKAANDAREAAAAARLAAQTARTAAEAVRNAVGSAVAPAAAEAKTAAEHANVAATKAEAAAKEALTAAKAAESYFVSGGHGKRRGSHKKSANANAGNVTGEQFKDWQDVMKLVKSMGSFKELEGAEYGKVVTRFPPEPSGFLHIGHCKAAMLNDYFARKWNGKLVLRFDDTNTDKATEDFQNAIVEDLKLLKIHPDVVDFTSDFFPKLLELAEKFIREGKAYVDCTPLEEMRTQRLNMEENEYRVASVEDNLKLWDEMKKGTALGKTACLRAKIDMKHKNGTMRDPAMYRCKESEHHRTGNTYKVYPTYDFSCPLVDSMEGVTHALRSLEYKDRELQYQWFCDAAGMRCPKVWEFARLDFQRTVLSKRKLQTLVDLGAVDGWDDPRFPTIQGVRRRGMTVNGLRAFILSQGASRNAVLMGWDKIWNVNKRDIDPVAPRHVGLETKRMARVTIEGAPEETRSLPKHKKNPAAGRKNVVYSKSVFIEGEDAAALKVGEIVTMMELGNVEILAVHDGGKKVKAKYLPKNSDFRGTVKLTWLAQLPDLTPIKAVTYSDLLLKDKLDADDKFEDHLNRKSKSYKMLSGDTNLKAVQKGDIIQLERRGYFICDSVHLRTGKSQAPMTLIEIPDGRLPSGLGSGPTKESSSGNKGKKKGGKQEPKLPDSTTQFHLTDLRVGKILTVGHISGSDALYHLSVDVGEAKPRSVCAGLRKFVPQADLEGRMVIVVCNLKPRKVKGVDSEAMCLAGSVVNNGGAKESVIPLMPPAGATPGTFLAVSGMGGERAVVKDKALSSKNWDRVVGRLAVKDGKACYDGKAISTGSAGHIVCALPDGAKIQ